MGEVLARDGFGGIGVTAIARQAAVDKVLIYRYFGSLPELLRAWGESSRFWPRVADLLGPEPQALLALPAAERYARFFEHFVDALRARPLTVAVLAGEVHERNELTAILEAEREQWGAEAAHVLGGAEWAQRPWLQGVTLLLVAGVQHLLVRSRQIRVFGGLDLHDDASWQTLKQSLRALAALMLADEPPAAAPAPVPRRTRR
ncbi:TetR/AcrR family transcriptional regulator [Aquabacterium sp. OR-4]|uniref:TetR/AcrR family transcriptional regulator n=1 Tax=Aquabacterium sp. OR-4 TaxID=2978127 RepID=UPI0021B297BD|nr:helix-turn-helix domain-containing protein [Aquabacterium sp. OR-4]MDT7837050.1 helix-turn-helix domain-containing protein [Aquabacterium sp. OR-4]